MNGFILKDFTLTVEDQLWGLLPFKRLLKRDRSRNKDIAVKEMLFIFYYTDIKSDYLIITNPEERQIEIKKDLGLPDDWKIDSVLEEAIDFYEKRSTTVISKLYKNALKAANDISDYLTRTDELLKAVDANGKPLHDVSKITMVISKVKNIMQDLKEAEKEVIKERIELEGKMKGSREMGMFELGLKFEE